MILGIDHIAVSTQNIHESARACAAAGFEIAFIENDILNGEPKRTFLSEFAPRHSIALCKPSHGIAIEFTRHATSSGQRGSYQISFGNDLPPLASAEVDEFAADEWSNIWQSAGYEQTTHSHPFALAGQPRPQIQSIGLRVSDLENSVPFWRDGLRFRAVARGNGPNGSRWERLSFRSIRPNWCVELLLVEDESATFARPMLDDFGATCLALITTDIQADLARLSCSNNDPFELDVAGKRLTIALLRGPDGEIIELIQPPAESTSARRTISPVSRTTHSFT